MFEKKSAINMEAVEELIRSLKESGQQIPEGLSKLLTGYGSYATEVATDRALPDVRDGLKPSQRRILYSMGKLDKVTDIKKCATIAGSVMKLHPHGDGPIYDTMVRMVEDTNYMMLPYLIGEGSFGRVETKSSPSSSRYTYAMLTPFAESIFKNFGGVNLVRTEDDEYDEPEALPMPVPAILYNASMGIAVGMASKFVSHNPIEVNNSLIELMETGTISKPLAPDFTTGGYYVHNEKELQKIMTTGRGQIKLRGKWHIDGKKIIITEVPYYTTTNSIAAKAEEIEGVADTLATTDRNGIRLEIVCSNKNVVDTVLTHLLKDTDLQMTLKTNMVTIVDGKPQTLGTIDIMRHWLDFRRGVVRSSLTGQLEYLNEKIPQYEILVDLLSHIEKRDEFVSALTQKGRAEAVGVLQRLYPDAEAFVFPWILQQTLNSLSGVASKENKLAQLRAEYDAVLDDLNNIDRVIIGQLKDFNLAYGKARRTEITNEDYNFDDYEEVIVKAAPVEVAFIMENKFMKKVQINRVNEDRVQGLRCMSDDIISIIDNQGRLLRVHLENISFCGASDRGTYLPVYLETEDDFEVVAYDVLRDEEHGYVYSDGYGSVLDLGEWVGNSRITRISTKGVSPLADMIVAEIDFSKSHMLVITEKGRFGFISTEFKHKHRTARTKLVDINKDDAIETVVPIDFNDMLKLTDSPAKYTNRVAHLSGGDMFDSEFYQELLERI